MRIKTASKRIRKAKSNLAYDKRFLFPAVKKVSQKKYNKALREEAKAIIEEWTN